MADCIFCQIANGQVDSEIIYQDELAVAFRDINPQAPTHIVLIPRQHIVSLDAAREEHSELLGHLALVAAQIARQQDLAEGGYRLVTNVGPDAGQAVAHLHFHIIGGRPMGWPPG